MPNQIKRSFSEIKSLSVQKKLNIQFTENERAYYVFIIDEIGTIYQNIIFKSSFLEANYVIGIDLTQNAIDETDFVANYKTLAEQTVSSNKPKTDDNRDYIYTTSRPVGTHTVFTSEGDDLSNYRFVGGGAELELFHYIGDPTTHNRYIDFNVIDNTTYIHEGYIAYSNCNNDRLSFYFVPRLTSFVPAPNTTFNLVNGFLIVPAAGDGNIQITEVPNLVCVGTDPNGNPNPGFWDADFNYTTGQFDNIRANPYGAGAYNIFGNEIIVYRMLQRIILKGSGKQCLETCEQGLIEHGFRMKVILEVNGSDHNCDISSILVIYREKATQMTR